MKPRTFVSFLLIASISVVLFSIPQANSQSAATTTTMTIPQLPSGQCSYISLGFEGQKGEVITGTYGSDASVSFYVLSGVDFAGIQNLNCRLPSNANPLFSDVNSVGHGNPYHTLLLPANGTYYFVFVFPNSSPTQLVSGHVTVELSYPTSITIVQASISPVSLSQSSTMAPLTSIQNATSSAAPTLPGGAFAIIGLVVAVGLIASVGVFMKRKKPQIAIPKQETVQKETKPETPEEPQPKPLVPGEDNLSTGYPELDRVLAGGLPVGYAILMVSPPCDERDLLFRKIIESSLSRNNSIFFMSRDLGRTQDFANRYKTNFYVFSPQADRIVADGNVFKIQGVQNLNDVNISFTKALETIPKTEASKLIIIDLLSDVLLEHKALTTRKWLDDFIAKRKAEGFTALGVLNPMISSKQDIQTVADLFDGIIEIYERELRERARRFLIVKKMYGRKYVDTELMLDKDKLF